MKIRLRGGSMSNGGVGFAALILASALAWGHGLLGRQAVAQEVVAQEVAVEAAALQLTPDKTPSIEEPDDSNAALILDLTEPPPQKWAGRFGAIILARASLPTHQPIVFDDFTKASLIKASDFDFPMTASFDLGLRRHLDQFDFDFRFFETRGRANGPMLAPHVYGPYDMRIGALESPNTFTTSSLGFVFDSAELNLRRKVSRCWALLAGFRYIGFTDELALRTAPEFVNSVELVNSVRTKNNLYGVQVGQEYLRPIGERLRVAATAKTGVFGNVAGSRFDHSSGGSNFLFGPLPFGSPELVNGRTTDRRSVSFVQEVNIACAYKLTTHWEIQTGYQLLWLVDVATVFSQLQRPAPPYYSPTNTSGSVLLQGLTVGLACGW